MMDNPYPRGRLIMEKKMQIMQRNTPLLPATQSSRIAKNFDYQDHKQNRPAVDRIVCWYIVNW